MASCGPIHLDAMKIRPFRKLSDDLWSGRLRKRVGELLRSDRSLGSPHRHLPDMAIKAKKCTEG